MAQFVGIPIVIGLIQNCIFVDHNNLLSHFNKIILVNKRVSHVDFCVTPIAILFCLKINRAV